MRFCFATQRLASIFENFVVCFYCRISSTEKGYMDVKMSVTAPPGHSSLPPSETSIGILAHAIAR